MNGQIRSLGIVLMVLFSAVLLQVSNLQLISAKRLNDHPANTRAVVRDFSRPRGAIQSSDGVVLAESVPADDDFKLLRRYPEPELFGHLTGFFSFTFGTDGVERSYNDLLTGRDSPQLGLDRLGDFLLERNRVGDLTLTVSKELQQTALDGLAGRKGSVVALDPRTGAVLAMASFPSYDPNRLAVHDQAEVRKSWDELNADPSRPLLARAYRERYFPGSSFKVVTAATALATGAATVDQPRFPVLSSLPLPQSDQPLRNFGGSACGGSLPQVLRVSCNTAFAQLGLDLGPERLSAGANAFGFGTAPPIDLPSPARSVFPPASAFVRNKPALAKSAIGQQDVQATPLQMALVAAGIANGGTIMTPHVLAEVRNSQAEVVKRYEPKPWLQAVPAAVAATTTEMMVGVVESGSGTRARIPGVQVAGKTGTAQTGLDRSHVWFISFAPAADPKVAVAVVLENQPSATEATGGALAAPIAKSVMEKALSLPAPLVG
ncbi:MAG: peptidoglycan D,D-transpeptidase FtsI family protein [Acidimicrobiales bacterium]